LQDVRGLRVNEPAEILDPSPDVAPLGYEPAVAPVPRPPPHPMDRYLRTDHLDGQLKRKTVRGGAVTMVSQAMKFALNLASTWVLFRILRLGPSDFGLVAMVVTVTGIINLFKDMGLLRATVQSDRITHEQTTALFWIGVGIGLAATVLSCALAPAVAWFYGEPRLVPIMLVLGTGFLFGGVSVQHQALMQRQMHFSKLAAVDIGAAIAGTLAAVVAAGMGAGYWSLVVQQLAPVIFGSAAQWLICGWRPGRVAPAKGVGSMLLFGGNLTAFNVISYAQRHFDAVLVGRLAGAYAMGVYGKAFQLLLLPITQVTTPMSNIAVPALARLQGDPERFRYFYRRCLEILSAVTMPIVALLYVAADEAIITLMGHQWESSVTVFRLLAPAAWIATFQVATNWVFLSLGNTGRQLRMILVVAPLSVAACFIGIHLGQRYFEGPLAGAHGMALAVSIAAVILRYPTILYCFEGTPLRQRDLFASIWRPTTASLMAGAALWAIDREFPSRGHEFARLLIESAVFAVAYLGAWLVLPGGAKFVTNLTGMIGDLRDRGRPGNDAEEFGVSISVPARAGTAP
jgi:O-antigen/teichoic acid export membrane protein